MRCVPLAKEQHRVAPKMEQSSGHGSYDGADDDGAYVFYETISVLCT